MNAQNILALCSAKGGAGRSLLCCCLGFALAERGQKTLLVDLDPQVQTLALYMGMEDQVLWGFDDLLKGRPAGDVLVEHPKRPGLFLCPAPEGPRTGAELSALLETVKKEGFDQILLDLPANGALCTAEGCATRHLVLCNQSPQEALLARKRAEELLKKGQQAHLLINRYDFSLSLEKEPRPMRASELIDTVGLPLIGIVPADPLLFQDTIRGTLFLRNDEASSPFKNLASRLMGTPRLLFAGMSAERQLRRGL